MNGSPFSMPFLLNQNHDCLFLNIEKSHNWYSDILGYQQMVRYFWVIYIVSMNGTRIVLDSWILSTVSFQRP